MSAQQDTSGAGDIVSSKGKGKAHPKDDVSMGEEDDSSDEDESGVEDHGGELEEPDEDNMEEIDTDNIIADGRRTRGKNIDFAKAAEEAGVDDEDDDEDDDFEDPDDSMKD